MTEMYNGYSLDDDFCLLTEDARKINQLDPEDFLRYGVKRGLRNADGTGVLAGLTGICNVHGYIVKDGERVPDDGELTYRGINIKDLVAGFQAEDRFGFEETAWLLLYGKLPTEKQLTAFQADIA